MLNGFLCLVALMSILCEECEIVHTAAFFNIYLQIKTMKKPPPTYKLKTAAHTRFNVASSK